MKRIEQYKNSIILLIGVVLVACSNSDFEDTTAKWRGEAKVFLNPTANQGFFYSKNQQQFTDDTIEYQVSIETSQLANFEAGRAEVYAFVEEVIDDERISHGGTEGRLVHEITSFEKGKALFTLTVDQINALYRSDLEEGTLSPDDFLELKYVLTGVNGEVFDSRIDCYGAHCQYVVKMDQGYVCTNHFEGEYDYEVIEKGGAASDGTIGATGTITIDRVNPAGEYDVSDAKFGTAFLGTTVPAKMHEFECEGVISLREVGNGLGWEFRNFNGPSVEIIITESWWANYLGLGWGYVYTVVRVTRKDGQDIPIVQGEFERVLGLNS